LLVVAGKRLTSWIVIDIDATVITVHSVKDGAAVTFKKTFGFHPLAVLVREHDRVPSDAAAEWERRVEHGGRPRPDADGS
jgi:hypothetical protein